MSAKGGDGCGDADKITLRVCVALRSRLAKRAPIKKSRPVSVGEMRMRAALEEDYTWGQEGDEAGDGDAVH